MAVSQARRLSIAKYRQEKRDQLAVDVPKGKRDEYKSAAAAMGFGYAEMIRLAIEEFIENHGGEVIHKPEDEKLTAEERRLLAAFAKLPKNAQINLIKTLEALSPKKEG